MNTVSPIRATLTTAILATAAPCLAQPDSFHLMQIQQVIGGVNGTTTRQAIQLRLRSSFENQVQFSQVRAWDAAGLNPIVIIQFPSPVPNFNGGDTILVTTPEFDAATTPACVPDFHMDARIPDSYLAAGRLTFEDTFGTIFWALAWGGSGYTGSNMGSATNSPTGNFGPPWAGPLPTTGTTALLFQGPFSALAGANATDYALTTQAAVFRSNARIDYTVTGGPAPCYPNCDGSTGSPLLNVNDFICFQSRFAAADPYADCDQSSSLNVNDFICFQGRFAAGCS